MAQPKNNRRGLTALALILSVILVALIVTAISLPEISSPSIDATNPTVTLGTDHTQPSTHPETEPPKPTEPPIVIESTATLAATGDILMHGPVIKSGLTSTGEYDFSRIFTYFSDYVTAADYAVANLETTLAGLNSGYKYSGYPSFNSPDAIVTSLKNAGFDMLLTANNHSYDTSSIGLRRTQQVITDTGLSHLGTKPTADTSNYLIADVNGIQIGMLCYTYESHTAAQGQTIPYEKKALNGNPLKEADAPLINSFDYDYLDYFYAEIQENIAYMEEAGADTVILFIHWGDEYHTKHNATQTAIAQKMCDLGVDVIIGGHPHVVQPVELLTAADGDHKTLCLYSMGNAVSNQNRVESGIPNSGHTEDGVLFSVTFTRYSDGTVILSDANLLPLWVNRHNNSQGAREYPILPLDKQIEDWKTQFSLTDAGLKKAQESYDRTMAIVGSGMTQAKEYLAQEKAQTEQALGIQ